MRINGNHLHFTVVAPISSGRGRARGQFAVHHEGRTWTAEFGEEKRGNGRPITAESKIPIGSISKTFTATLAMVLVSDGDLDLDSPVREYLPDLHRLGRDLGGRLTLRHLLSHTGGLPSDQEHGQTVSLRRHVLECFRHVDPLHGPGRAFSYSNIGYVIAGHLIEAVTGMSWWEAMELVLLKPLELTPTFVVGPGPRRRMVTGHAVNPARGRVRPVRQSLATADAPAGALAASASDLVALGRFLSGGNPSTLIDPALLAEMRTPVTGAEPFGIAHAWGLGLAIFRDGDRDLGRARRNRRRDLVPPANRPRQRHRRGLDHQRQDRLPDVARACRPAARPWPARWRLPRSR